MKTEELKELGLTPEQAKQVLAMNGRDIERLKAANDTLKTENSTLASQLSELGGENVQALRESAEEWKLRAEQAEAEAEQRLEKQRFDFLLDSALAKSGAKSQRVVRALLDLDSLRLENGDICGLAEQLSALREENGYLFEDELPKPRFCAAAGGAPASGMEAVRAAMGLPDET